MQETQVPSLVQENPICWEATKPVHHYWASVLFYSPGAAATDALSPGAHAPQEKPPQWEACTAQLESSPQSLQTREKAVQQQRLKKKKKNECLKTVIIQLFI